MAITDQTRKVLWSLAGNSCARCRTLLVQVPEAATNPHAIVGRECHIVARSPDGPRGAAARGDIDAYDNLILLCANCHAVVDGQPEQFTVEVLKTLKQEHEQRIAATHADGAPRFQWRLEGRDKPLRLTRVDDGDSLLASIGSRHSFQYRSPAAMSAEQRTAVGNFLQECQDWGDIYGEIGPKGQLDAAEILDGHLQELHELGLLVFAAARRLALIAEGESSPWIEAVVHVAHEHEVRVKRDDVAAGSAEPAAGPTATGPTQGVPR